MKIYNLTQSENTEHDAFGTLIVCAKSAKDARLIHPYDDDSNDFSAWESSSFGWTSSPKNVSVQFLGMLCLNDKETPKNGIICRSFD